MPAKFRGTTATGYETIGKLFCAYCVISMKINNVCRENDKTKHGTRKIRRLREAVVCYRNKGPVNKKTVEANKHLIAHSSRFQYVGINSAMDPTYGHYGFDENSVEMVHCHMIWSDFSLIRIPFVVQDLTEWKPCWLANTSLLSSS